MYLPIKLGTARRMGLDKPKELPEPPVALRNLADTMVYIQKSIHRVRPFSQVLEEADRDYWDFWGHLSTCPVWGDDQMIERCTCGPAHKPCRRRSYPECYGKEGTQRCGSCSMLWLRPSA